MDEEKKDPVEGEPEGEKPEGETPAEGSEEAA
jgi:hypothetical protein